MTLAILASFVRGWFLSRPQWRRTAQTSYPPRLLISDSSAVKRRRFPFSTHVSRRTRVNQSSPSKTYIRLAFVPRRHLHRTACRAKAPEYIFLNETNCSRLVRKRSIIPVVHFSDSKTVRDRPYLSRLSERPLAFTPSSVWESGY